MPGETAENLTSGAVAAAIGAGEFKQLPAVIPDTASDVVLLFEIGDLSLRHAAAAIIDQRPDLAELATRLFTRSDEVERAWTILDPILDAWSSGEGGPLHFYAAGSWGPPAATELLARDGRDWRSP